MYWYANIMKNVKNMKIWSFLIVLDVSFNKHFDGIFH